MSVPDAPVFLMQQGYVNRGAIKPVAKSLSKEGAEVPGLLLSLDDVALSVVRDTISNGIEPMTPLLIDPGVHRYSRKTIGGKTLKSAPWIARNAPSDKASWKKTIEEAQKEQRDRGADALITPGVELEATDHAAFQAQIDAVVRAAALRPDDDPPWFVRVCVHEEWLDKQPLQRLLLSQLTDLSDELGVALHVRWRKDGILRDKPRLEALRKVVEVIANDDRDLLLMQSGILGWLSLGWGSWGFSAGLAHGQGWLDTGLIRFGRPKGQKSPPRKKRFFERGIIHNVLDSDHARLSTHASYSSCSCGFCANLGSGQWDHLKSQQHGLCTLAKLTERVRKSSVAARPEAVKKEIDDALAEWKALSGVSGLDSAGTPRHLDIWSELL
jgi:hypothetical protein